MHLRPGAKAVLREVAFHDHSPLSAREIALNVNIREEYVRKDLDYLRIRSLVAQRHNGHAYLWRVTPQGRETVDQIVQQRLTHADQKALIAAAAAAAIVMCPACHGERIRCDTCVGCRVVTREQAAAYEERD